MTKETLKSFGLTDEQIEKIWNNLTENYVPKSRFSEVTAEKNHLREQLKERDDQLETLKTATGAVDALKQQISELQSCNQQKDKEHAVEVKRLKREALDERLLVEARAINPLAVKPFLKAIDDSVDDEGYTALRKQQIEALLTAESTKFLFSAVTEAEKFTGVKPGESGGAKPKGDGANPFAKESYNEAEQIKLFRENPEMAKALAKQAGIRFI
jgi:hypothetical protein